MSTPILQLPASDEEINALVAEKVAGWMEITIHPSGQVIGTHPMGGPRCQVPDYLHDANAVIELLGEATPHGDIRIKRRQPSVGLSAPWTVQLNSTLGPIHRGETFCLAACYALLRAHGVTVLEAK